MSLRSLARAFTALLFVLPAAAQSQTLPVASFFQYPSFSSASLSPDGTRVAMLLAAKGGSTMLAVMDVAMQTPKVLVNAKSDVASYRWVNDNRIVFSMTDRDMAAGEVFGGPGIFAINADGSELKELAERRRSPGGEVRRFQKDVLPAHTQLMAPAGKQDSDFVYVTQVVQSRDHGHSVALLKVDTRSGKAEPVKRVDAGRDARTIGWMLDQNGEPRISLVRDGAEVAMYYNDPATNAWRKLGGFDPFGANVLSPHSFGPDGTFYVRSRQGNDKIALYSYDLKENRLNPRPVVAMADYDFNGALVLQGDKLLGVRYLVDAPGTLWYDEKRKADQAKVDALLPSTINALAYARRGTSTYTLVFAASDAQPGLTYLFNTETGKLDLLGEAQPDIDARQMGRTTMVRYKARDGLEIPAYLTLPKNAKKNLPLVVLVHGGPWVRGGFGLWDGEVQFLVSRGYAVLQPEFRGSAGFGDKHLRASFKQWGQAMQDDLADGAKWAVAQGIADPQRMCIAGASYGGYATMMGLVRDADLFRCGVNWVGVTDINLWYDVHWSDTDDLFKTWGMPVMIGDQVKDAAMLKAASPLENAAKITRPVLMAYGTADRRVPIIHGTKMRDAMIAAGNKNVEWVEYAEEAHGWRVVRNRIDFWTRVEKFLDTNIGPGAGAK